MDFKNFEKVYGRKDLRFSDIWRIYDSQFDTIKNFLMTLGDKYSVEEFTGDISKTLRLSNSYSSGQLFVYLNGVIQWKDTDYRESSPNTITLKFARKTSDVIKVIVIHSNIFQVNIESYVKQIQEIYENSTSSLEKAQNLIEVINNLENELNIKREEFENTKNILEKFLYDFDEKVERTDENTKRVEEMKSEVDTDIVESNACLNKIKSLKEAIEALSLLTPEEIIDNEVVLARNGATTLGHRLNGMIYKFKSVTDMQQCDFLQEGDECLVTDDSNQSEIISAKLYRVCLLAEDIPGYVTEYHRILVGDYKYAYLINEIASIQYLNRVVNESRFELDVKSQCQSYGLSSLIIENFEDTSSFDFTDESTNKVLSSFWNQAAHDVSYTSFENNSLKTKTMNWESTPSYMLVMCDFEGTGTVDLKISFNGGTNKFSVENRKLIDLSNIFFDDGKQMHPSVRMVGYITLNGDVTLKNICWAVR